MEKTYDMWELETINICLLSHTRALMMKLSSCERVIESLRAELEKKNENVKRGRPLGFKNKSKVKRK